MFNEYFILFHLVPTTQVHSDPFAISIRFDKNRMHFEC